MAKRADAKASDGLVTAGATDKLELTAQPDETSGRTLARVTIDPLARNANLAASFGSAMFGDRLRPAISESTAALAEHVERTANGDLSLATRIHTAHALSLDALFTDLARRSGNNMGEYPDAADRYMRLALKAQSACRATLEALAKLHSPREQTVRHVHINEGGQAVIADQFHHHPGGRENGKSSKQSHATGAAGPSVALPGPHAQGDTVPVPGRARKAAMQDARGD